MVSSHMKKRKRGSKKANAQKSGSRSVISISEAIDKAARYENLGDSYRDEGQNVLAQNSYLSALSLLPDNPRLHNKLGNIYARLNKREKALKSFKKVLEYNPDDVVVKHAVAALLGESPSKAPELWVKTLFDDMAETFEQHLVHDLSYRVPEKLLESLENAFDSKDHFFDNCVDLGCGTGLTGKTFRSLCGHLTGVDLSRKMIQESRKKGVYDQLIAADVDDVFSQLTKNINLFLATDLFIYVGELRNIFSKIKEYAAADALFLFSVERLTGKNEYQLLPTGRYAQSCSYISSLAEACGMTILLRQPTTIREEKGKDIAGDIYVLQVHSKVVSNIDSESDSKQ